MAEPLTTDELERIRDLLGRFDHPAAPDALAVYAPSIVATIDALKAERDDLAGKYDRASAAWEDAIARAEAAEARLHGAGVPAGLLDDVRSVLEDVYAHGEEHLREHCEPYALVPEALEKLDGAIAGNNELLQRACDALANVPIAKLDPKLGAVCRGCGAHGSADCEPGCWADAVDAAFQDIAAVITPPDESPYASDELLCDLLSLVLPGYGPGQVPPVSAIADWTPAQREAAGDWAAAAYARASDWPETEVPTKPPHVAELEAKRAAELGENSKEG